MSFFVERRPARKAKLFWDPLVYTRNYPIIINSCIMIAQSTLILETNKCILISQFWEGYLDFIFSSKRCIVSGTTLSSDSQSSKTGMYDRPVKTLSLLTDEIVEYLKTVFYVAKYKRCPLPRQVTIGQGSIVLKTADAEDV